MKINWGTGIVIAFSLFITFILYFVFKVQSDSKYDNELVVEEYYKYDVHFQEEMKRVQDAYDLTEKPVFNTTPEGVRIVFPAVFIPKNLKGKLTLYRPSNKKLDFEIPISLSDATLFIPKSRLVGGYWDINMEWSYEGRSYLTKQKVYIN